MPASQPRDIACMTALSDLQKDKIITPSVRTYRSKPGRAISINHGRHQAPIYRGDGETKGQSCSELVEYPVSRKSGGIALYPARLAPLSLSLSLSLQIHPDYQFHLSGCWNEGGDRRGAASMHVSSLVHHYLVSSQHRLDSNSRSLSEIPLGV